MSKSKKFSYSFVEEKTGIEFTVSECGEKTLKARAMVEEYKYDSEGIEFAISKSVKPQDINKKFEITAYRESDIIRLVYEIAAIDFRREFVLVKEKVDANTELHIMNRKLMKKIASLEKEIEAIKKIHHFGMTPINECIEFWIDKKGIFMKGNPDLITRFGSLMDNIVVGQGSFEISEPFADELKNLKNHRYFAGNQNYYVNILYTGMQNVGTHMPSFLKCFHNENITYWSSSTEANQYEKALRESGKNKLLLLEVLVYYMPVFSVFDTSDEDKKKIYAEYKKTNRVKIGEFNRGLCMEVISGVRPGKTILLNHERV